MKTLLAAILLATSTQAQSQDVWLDLKLPSIHEDSTYIHANEVRDFETNTFGVGMSFPLNEHFEWRGGVYNNKFNNVSAYAYANGHTSSNNTFAVGVNAGLATGYDDTAASDKDVAIKLIPHITYYFGNFRAEVGYDIAINTHTSEVTTLLPEFADVDVTDRTADMYGTTPKYTNSSSITFTVGYKF